MSYTKYRFTICKYFFVKDFKKMSSHLSVNNSTKSVTWWFIRTHFESTNTENDNQIFPKSIKLLCSSFIGILLNEEWEAKSILSKRIEIYGSKKRWIKKSTPSIYKHDTTVLVICTF